MSAPAAVHSDPRKTEVCAHLRCRKRLYRVTLRGTRAEQVLVDAEPAECIYDGEAPPVMFEWDKATQTYLGGRVAVRLAQLQIRGGRDVHRVHSCS